MGTIGLQLPAPAIYSYVWKRRYRRLKFSPRRLLETLTLMTPISTESSARPRSTTASRCHPLAELSVDIGVITVSVSSSRHGENF